MWDGGQTKKFITCIAEIMNTEKEELIRLDSVVGDGDLGLTMSDGFGAASAAVTGSGEEDIGKLLYFAGKAMASAVPSTMGTLMANGMLAAGKALKNQTQMDTPGMYRMMEAWLEGVQKMGKAQRGEKTFVDGLAPAVDTLREAQNTSMKEAAAKAAEAAQKGAEATVGMKAVHGRAAIRGEESRELLDPGAVVASLIVQALEKSLQQSE